MTERMAKLDRLLALVHALSETAEGLTLDDLATRLGVNRRTAERMRDIIARHFELEERADDRRKRFLIRESLCRVYTRPNAAEVAALQAEVDGRALAPSPAQPSSPSSLRRRREGFVNVVACLPSLSNQSAAGRLSQFELAVGGFRASSKAQKRTGFGRIAAIKLPLGLGFPNDLSAHRFHAGCTKIVPAIKRWAPTSHSLIAQSPYTSGENAVGRVR